MINYLILLFMHWVADFILQSDAQAKGKSSQMQPLLEHTMVYSLVLSFAFLVVLSPLHNVYLPAIALVITFVAHTITDYFTSRLNKKLWLSGNAHKFFVAVGFDQFLHFAQLFITYAWLKSVV